MNSRTPENASYFIEGHSFPASKFSSDQCRRITQEEYEEHMLISYQLHHNHDLSQEGKKAARSLIQLKEDEILHRLREEDRSRNGERIHATATRRRRGRPKDDGPTKHSKRESIHASTSVGHNASPRTGTTSPQRNATHKTARERQSVSRGTQARTNAADRQSRRDRFDQYHTPESSGEESRDPDGFMDDEYDDQINGPVIQEEDNEGDYPKIEVDLQFDGPFIAEDKNKLNNAAATIRHMRDNINNAQYLMGTDHPDKHLLQDNIREWRGQLKAAKLYYRSRLADIQDISTKKNQSKYSLNIPKNEIAPGPFRTTTLVKEVPQCGTVSQPASTFSSFYDKLVAHGIAHRYDHSQYLRAMAILLQGEVHRNFKLKQDQQFTFPEIIQSMTTEYITNESIID